MRDKIMKIILVRHGQTKENIVGILQGPESKLTEFGKQQAKIVAEKLKNEKIDMIYVSDLKRAQETAEEIIKLQPDAKIVYTKELREKNIGIFTGRPLEEQKIAREKSGLTFYDFAPEKGESLIDVRNRMIKFYSRLLEKNQNKTILLVAHQGPIITLLLYLLGKSFEEYGNYRMENTAITEIVIGKRTKPIINLSRFLRIPADSD